MRDPQIVFAIVVGIMGLVLIVSVIGTIVFAIVECCIEKMNGK